MADGLVTLRSAHDFPTTLDRLLKALEAKGVTVFARIDHAAGAAGVGLPLAADDAGGIRQCGHRNAADAG